MSSLDQSIRKHLRFNVTVNLLDGALFGVAWGFGSFGTVIPLFVSRMTDSALLIGLIPAIHAVGWQLPQLFMAGAVARLRRYKPLVMWLTIHERIPYLGLVVVAFALATLGTQTALIITFLMLVWQGLGAGITANPWQSMIAKIIPAESRGTFFGAQSALANIMISLTAVLAGFLLNRLDSRWDFTTCFLLTTAGMAVSFILLGLTREPTDEKKVLPRQSNTPWREWWQVLRRDRNFSAYLLVRVISQFATMGFAFYIVFGLRKFAMDEVTAGFLTAALTISQTIANVVMGWLGDRIGHRAMLIAGAFAIVGSSMLAWGAVSLAWLYPVVILSAIGNVSFWTIGMAITTQFGSEESRPIYIGLSNTLVAPFTIIAPLIGGWIADSYSFQATFLTSAIGGLVVVVLLFWLVRDPRKPSVMA